LVLLIKIGLESCDLTFQDTDLVFFIVEFILKVILDQLSCVLPELVKILDSFELLDVAWGHLVGVQ